MFYIFDFDGVIINSSKAINKAVSQVYAHIGQPSPSVATSDKWIGPGPHESVTNLRAMFGLSEHLQVEIEDLFFASYVAVAAENTEFNPGMEALLEEIANRNVPRALATMKAQTEFDAIGQPLPGLEYFEVFVPAPSHKEPISKKLLVGWAIERLKASGEGTMIGDRASDVAAGQAHGLRTIGVTWGAGTADELKEANCDHVIDTAGELRGLLLP